MKRIGAVAPALLLVLLSCARSGKESPQGPPSFEIQDFVIKTEDKQYTTSWEGRGTLLTKDPRLQKGDFIVYLVLLDKANGTGPWEYSCHLKNGIAPLETSDFKGKEADDAGKRKPDYEWRLTGYVPLQPGTLTVGK